MYVLIVLNITDLTQFYFKSRFTDLIDLVLTKLNLILLDVFYLECEITAALGTPVVPEV